MRAFKVKLPSGARYWTVVDDELAVVPEADAYLRHLRLGRDSAELTTKSYAGALALFLAWCGRTGLARRRGALGPVYDLAEARHWGDTRARDGG